VTEVIVETIERVTPGRVSSLDFQIFNHFIRKNAHFLLYFVLGMLVMNALIQTGYKNIWLALLICVLYAVSDEVHQTFVPGRGGMVSDVVLDSVGAFIGIWVYLLFKRFFLIK
jgi:VanZ family protein